jgi:hypothetical protein
MNEFQSASFYDAGIAVLNQMGEKRIEDFMPEHTDALLETLALVTTNFGADWESSDVRRQKIFSNTLLDELQKAVNFDTTNRTIVHGQLQEAFMATAQKVKAQ